MSDALLPLRIGTPDDWDAVSRLLFHAFNEPFEEELVQLDRPIYEPARGLLAEDQGAVVAHAAALTRDLTVPGGVLPAAHVTMVGVAPTHRRRGLLTRMMHRQLREVHDAGREPLAVLWASEGGIYQRFGYGLAAQKLDWEIENRELGFPPVPAGGQLREVDPVASWKELASAYERVRASRPGWSSRDERRWRYLLADPSTRRRGGTEQRAVVVDGPDGIDGYALWNAKDQWTAAGPAGEVLVKEVVAAGTAAYLALWQLLLSVDLTRTVRFGYAALDEPLLHLVAEPRRLGARFAESLWVRVVDVPGALAARRYAADVDVVIDVVDPVLPANAGRFRLTGGPRQASCAPTTAPADLSCGVRELGAAYLGGTTLAALAAAGRVRELRPGAVLEASTAFGWHRAPAAIEMF